MRVRFLLGPAGTGKTHRCLAGIRECLSRSPDGPPLILLAPNQATYQLERQLLAFSDIQGFTRLHVLSFERLAYLLWDWLAKPSPELLDEDGRVMVLRALLARKHSALKLFRASARLTGFAQHLSDVLRGFQQHQVTPESLEQLAARLPDPPSVAYKLQDFAELLRQYSAWLASRGLQDSECLLPHVTQALRDLSPSAQAKLAIGGLWVDGFSEFTAQEIELLSVLLPRCENATITFCLDPASARQSSWVSAWSAAHRTFQAAWSRLSSVAGADCFTEILPRDVPENRFAKVPFLRHLEQHWVEPKPFPGTLLTASSPEQPLRLVVCRDPSAEVVVAAQEMLGWVRAGGRFRDIAVLVRDLTPYQHHFQHHFARYEIPFFLDRRESMAHHPAAELTRSALRTVALGWQDEDWFAALKTGLVGTRDEEIDQLENEALARGWHGAAWQQPLKIREQARSPEDEQRLRRLESQLESLRLRLVAPFERLAAALRLSSGKPTGAQLATALRQFWTDLDVAGQLEHWPDNAEPPGLDAASSVHHTVWTQINSWLDNVELAFSDEPLPIREWLPILEAGLSNLTVGLIPPALDQVLVGTVDRSRNPDPKLVLLLGMNESVFPALPDPGGLLTASDRDLLETHGALPGSSPRQHLGREAYLAYLACTRPSARLVLTCASRDENGKALNPSPFLNRFRLLFPGLEPETASAPLDPNLCFHKVELVEALLASRAGLDGLQGAGAWPAFLEECELSGLGPLAGALRQFQEAQLRCSDQALDPLLAARLYGPALRTSVSRMEQFAACPFRFFINSGLRAQERRRFELDSREQGSFQHEVLARFHEQLKNENKSWRDVTPLQARERIGRIAENLVGDYREGLLQTTDQTRFLARVLTESLQDFVEVLVGWMREQYQFDPVAVELPFGNDPQAPAWTLDLPGGQKLELYGRIDRIDFFRQPGSDEALCVVVDYKSGHKQLDPLLMQHGVQLQLLAYLSVLRHWPAPALRFGVSRLVPAGVFYVQLRGKAGFEQRRSDALLEPGQARKLAYRHTGRFDSAVLRQLDARADAQHGDQFNYRVTKSGALSQNCREPLASSDFTALLDSVEANLRAMGSRIYAGVVEVRPYRKGTSTACDYCDYKAICRIDPWTHQFRALKKEEPVGL